LPYARRLHQLPHGPARHPRLLRGGDGAGRLPSAARHRPAARGLPPAAPRLLPDRGGPRQRELRPPLPPLPGPHPRHDRNPSRGAGMRVHIIGCSGSFAGPESAASSYLLEAEDEAGRTWRVLMDLGSGAFGPLQSVIDPADLDAVVISHLHPDHYLDLTGLEVFWAYHSRTDLGQLPIHAPAPLPERLNAVLSREGCIPDGVDRAPFEHHILADGARFTIGPFAFETRSVLHPVEAYGFRITCG